MIQPLRTTREEDPEIIRTPCCSNALGLVPRLTRISLILFATPGVGLLLAAASQHIFRLTRIIRSEVPLDTRCVHAQHVLISLLIPVVIVFGYNLLLFLKRETNARSRALVLDTTEDGHNLYSKDVVIPGAGTMFLAAIVTLLRANIFAIVSSLFLFWVTPHLSMLQFLAMPLVFAAGYSAANVAILSCLRKYEEEEDKASSPIVFEMTGMAVSLSLASYLVYSIIRDLQPVLPIWVTAVAGGGMVLYGFMHGIMKIGDPTVLRHVLSGNVAKKPMESIDAVQSHGWWRKILIATSAAFLFTRKSRRYMMGILHNIAYVAFVLLIVGNMPESTGGLSNCNALVSQTLSFENIDFGFNTVPSRSIGFIVLFSVLAFIIMETAINTRIQKLGYAYPLIGSFLLSLGWSYITNYFDGGMGEAFMPLSSITILSDSLDTNVIGLVMWLATVSSQYSCIALLALHGLFFRFLSFATYMSSIRSQS